jgi:hypothetical protein
VNHELKMKFASLSFAILALVTGLIAAYYWYQASKVEVVPLWQELGTIEPLGGGDTHWIVGMLKAAQKSGALNKLAALWTAASVALSAFSAVIGAWPFGC